MAQAFMQNGGRFSTALDIFNSPSMADMRNKIEQSEDDQSQREAQAQEQQAEQAQAALAQQQEQYDVENEHKDKDRLLKKYEIDTKAMVEHEKLIQVDGTNSDKTLEQSKLDLDYKTQADDLLVKMKTLDQDWQKAKLDSNTKKALAKEKPAKTIKK